MGMNLVADNVVAIFVLNVINKKCRLQVEISFPLKLCFKQC